MLVCACVAWVTVSFVSQLAYNVAPVFLLYYHWKPCARGPSSDRIFVLRSSHSIRFNSDQISSLTLSYLLSQSQPWIVPTFVCCYRSDCVFHWSIHILRPGQLGNLTFLGPPKRAVDLVTVHLTIIAIFKIVVMPQSVCFALFLLWQR